MTTRSAFMVLTTTFVLVASGARAEEERPRAVSAALGWMMPYGHIRQSARPGPALTLSYRLPLTQEFGLGLEAGGAAFRKNRLGAEVRDTRLVWGAAYGRLLFRPQAPARPYVMFGLALNSKSIEFSPDPPAPPRASETESQLGVLSGAGVALGRGDALRLNLEARLMSLPSFGPKAGLFLEDRALLLTAAAVWRFEEAGDWEVPGEFHAAGTAGRSIPRYSFAQGAGPAWSGGGEFLWWPDFEVAFGFGVERALFPGRVIPAGVREQHSLTALRLMARASLLKTPGAGRLYAGAGPALHSLETSLVLANGSTNTANRAYLGYWAGLGGDFEHGSDLVFGAELRWDAMNWGLSGGRRVLSPLVRVGTRFSA